MDSYSKGPLSGTGSVRHQVWKCLSLNSRCQKAQTTVYISTDIRLIPEETHAIGYALRDLSQPSGGLLQATNRFESNKRRPQSLSKLIYLYSFLISYWTWLLGYIVMASFSIHSLLPLFIMCAQSEGQDEHRQTNPKSKTLHRLSDLQAEVPPML